MKFIIPLLFFVSHAFAAEIPSEVIPFSKIPFTDVDASSLPKKLREALLNTDDFSQSTTRLPKILRICEIDLNNDGSPEYIVNSNQSYSGGTARVIYEFRDGSYIDIAYFQAGFYLAKKFNGYYQIVSNIGRDRGGEYAPHVLRYIKNEYKDITQP